MAERTGVTEREPESGTKRGRSRRGARGAGGPGKPGDWFKKHKGLAIAGGLGGVVLLMSHKGSQGSGAGNSQQADQLQQEADTLAAEEAAAGGIYGASGGGGGSDSDDSDNGSTQPPTKRPKPGRKPPKPGRRPPGGHGHDHDHDRGHDHDHDKDDRKGTGHHRDHDHDKDDKGKKSHDGDDSHPGKHGSGKGHGEAKGDHDHDHKPANPHSNHSGGAGITVHGRTFPGAKGHHVGPDQRHPNGGTSNRVTVHYGGHTDTHTSINKGAAWHDHTGGPPSRATAARRARVAAPAQVRRERGRK